MSVFDIFKAAPPGAPTPGTPIPGQPAIEPVIGAPTGTNIPAPNVAPVLSPGTGPNGIVPDNTVPDPNAKPAEPTSPIDQYKELWQTPVKKDGEDDNKPEALAPIIDSKQLQKKVGTIDFSNTITPEVLAAVTAGGEEGTKALFSAMNSVAQNVMVQTTLVSNKLLEQAVERTRTQTLESIPGLIRTHALASNLSENNPAFNNPAIKPLMDMTQAQFALKFPDATALELAKMSEEYISTVVKTLTPTQQNSLGNPLERKETDFSMFLDPTQTG